MIRVVSLLSLCVLVLISYVEGHAIIGSSNKVISAADLISGSLITLKPYVQDQELPDTQNWLIDSDGYIRINHYPQFVLTVEKINNVFTPILRDVADIVDPITAQWKITPYGEASFYVENKANSYLRLNKLSVNGLFTPWNPYPTYDYIVVGAGTAGCRISKKLTDNFKTSVLTLEAGKFQDDNPIVQGISTLRAAEGSSALNFEYYSERIQNLNYQKVPAAVGRMWGGTSNHNGMLYTKGLHYDWDLMEKYGGPQWNYENYMKQLYLNQENYTGTVSEPGVYGNKGEIDLVDSVLIPDVIEVPLVSATTAVYPTFRPFDLDDSLTRFKLTMQNKTTTIIRESSSTAHFNGSVVNPGTGKGVNGRKLTVISECFADRLIFHSFFKHRAIGIEYVDRNGEKHKAYANIEVILAAGTYNSPAILMRSGVGNCSELAAINITCLENNMYVGSNLGDHMRVQTEFTAPISNALAVIASANVPNTDGHLVEGVYVSEVGVNYTDFNVSNTTQPDTKMSILVASQIPYVDLNTLFSLNWLETFSLPAIFEFAAVLLRPKCTGKLSISTPLPVPEPLINHDYLCHPDDVQWARSTFRAIQRIIKVLNTTYDPSYKSIFPTPEQIDTDAKLNRFVKGLTTGYRHPTGTLRMAPRDSINKGVINGNLCVYGISRVRVADASIFPVVPSANPQATVYVVASKAVELIKNPHTSCNYL